MAFRTGWKPARPFTVAGAEPQPPAELAAFGPAPAGHLPLGQGAANLLAGSAAANWSTNRGQPPGQTPGEQEQPGPQMHAVRAASSAKEREAPKKHSAATLKAARVSIRMGYLPPVE